MIEIAGKTDAEILAMPRSTRCAWYKTLSTNERELAKELVRTHWRAKLRAAWTPKKRAKMSASRTGEGNPNYGKSPSKKTRAKQRVAATAYVFTEEHRAKLSAAGTGRVHSVETRAKQSVVMMGEKNPNFGRTGENNHLFGKPRSPEDRAKISAGLKEFWRKVKARAKQRELLNKQVREKYWADPIRQDAREARRARARGEEE